MAHIVKKSKQIKVITNESTAKRKENYNILTDPKAKTKTPTLERRIQNTTIKKRIIPNKATIQGIKQHLKENNSKTAKKQKK